MNKTAIIVGSGFGGIAASLRMRSLGYQVSIFEKLNQLGGRARVFKNLDSLLTLDQQLLLHPFYLMNYLNYLIKTERIM